jgi:hypothetical protein
MGEMRAAKFEGKEDDTMKHVLLPEGAGRLLALAEDIAMLFAEKRDELCISLDVEALLQASIASATFAFNTYVAVVEASKRSDVAQSYVLEAKSRYNRSMKQLKRRVRRCIVELRRRMEFRDRQKLDNHVASMI